MKKSSGTVEEKLLSQIRRPDLSILGDAIRKLSPMQWRERMFFAGVDDIDLKKWTGGFPATFRNDYQTHPVFVLSCRPSGHLLCPCSSKGRKNCRHIQKGCEFEMKQHISKQNSYLIETFRFTLPLDTRFSREPIFIGRVPLSCIVDRQ